MTSGSTTPRATPDPARWRERVPHRGNALLVSELVRHAGDETACRVVIDDQTLFRDEDGSVPAWVGLEYMAQCIAVHAAMVSTSDGPPPLGFLVSARGLRFHCERFLPGQRLEAVATRLWSGAGGLSSFACELRDAASGALLAEGRIGCFVPPDGELGAFA